MQRTDPKAVPCLLLKHVACAGRGPLTHYLGGVGNKGERPGREGGGGVGRRTLGVRQCLLHFPRVVVVG